MKIFDLWTMHPGNLVGEYESEAEALAMVRELLDSGWPADDLSLGWYDTTDPEQGAEIVNGFELAERARAAAGDDQRRSA